MTQSVLIINPWYELAKAMARVIPETGQDYLIVSHSAKLVNTLEAKSPENPVFDADPSTELGIRNSFATCTERFGGVTHLIFHLAGPSEELITDRNHWYDIQTETLGYLDQTMSLARTKIGSFLETLNAAKTNDLPEEEDKQADTLPPLRGSISVVFSTKLTSQHRVNQRANLLKEHLVSFVRSNAPQLAKDNISTNLFSVDRVSEADLDLKIIKSRYAMDRPADEETLARCLLNFLKPEMAFITGHHIDLNGGIIQR